MNSRERINCVVKKRQPADKVPWIFNFGATQGFNPRLLKRYKEFMGINEHIDDYLDYDVINVLSAERTGMKNWLAGGIGMLNNGIKFEDYYGEKDKVEDGFLSQWGVYNKPWALDPTFENFISPLSKVNSIKDIENYPSPKLDFLTFSAVKKEAAEIKSKGKMSSAYTGAIYEWSWYIRSQEEFLMDLCINPKYVEALVEKVSEFVKELCIQTVKCGVDVIACYDDFGTQTSMQMRPDHFRKFIKPGWKRIWEAVKKENPDTIIFLHSCGCIEEIIPDLIEIGLDVLHPIQPETMDVYKIGEKYQKDITIWDTVSSQKTIPFGSPKDIGNEIRERVEKMGKKGAFILSPANIMGPEVPLENINAFIEAARKYC